MSAQLSIEPGTIARLVAFVRERHAIYVRRYMEKLPPPWTDDPILQTYKFCNIYRELDRVTIWVREHIREQFVDHSLLWFMLAMARQINWPGTLEEVIADRKGAWPHNPKKWSYVRLAQILLDRKGRGETVYTGAYMLTCQWPLALREKVSSEKRRSKCWYTAEVVLKSLWEDRMNIGQQMHGTLAQAHAVLLAHQGWGDFLAAQVVADLKHTRYLKDALDWWDWGVLGPGSCRGLNRVLGTELNTRHSADSALEWLKQIRAVIWSQTGQRLCLQDVQNTLCEFDKYERTRLGEGRPRSKFHYSVV